MKKFVLKRTCIALLTVFLILLLLFLMLDFMPGSPFNNEEKMSAEQIADLYHKYGLDQPIINRFFLYLKNMLHGDFGISYSLQVNMKISEMIGPKILVTIRLGLQAALVGTVIGALLGIMLRFVKIHGSIPLPLLFQFLVSAFHLLYLRFYFPTSLDLSLSCFRLFIIQKMNFSRRFFLLFRFLCLLLQV